MNQLTNGWLVYAVFRWSITDWQVQSTGATGKHIGAIVVRNVNGARPHFKCWLEQNMPQVAAGWKRLDDQFYSYWGSMPYNMPG
ncbi:MAG: hypothetical protein H6841_05300 [Planctomycetes bacterium]|nr:hypothetical protein [Planctomycetota bacterium]